MQAAIPELSIIIVHYRTPVLLQACISSIIKHVHNIDYELIVVDNHSEDNTKTHILQEFTQVSWVDMPSNNGFSSANNAGIKQAKGKYLLLLNSDTKLFDDAVQKTLNYFKKLEQENKNPGFVACRVISKDDSWQHTANIKYPTILHLLKANPLYIYFARIFNIKNKKELTADAEKRHLTSHKPLWLGFPFALFKADICRKENQWMDEDFFMYSEDVEWNYRLQKQGYQHYYYAEAAIYHHNGGSATENTRRQAQILISEWLFIYKAYGALYYLCYLLLFTVNLLLDNILHKLSRAKTNADDTFAKAHQERKRQWQILKKYGLDIFSNYKRATSLSKLPLRYEA